MFNKSSKTHSPLPDKTATSTKDWLPIKDITNRILSLKNGDYLSVKPAVP
jgi:hypothetical protein